RARRGIALLEELDRDFAVERSVPRSPDLTVGALADRLEQREVAPLRWVRRGHAGFPERGRGLGHRALEGATEVSDPRQIAKRAHAAALTARLGGGLRLVPVDGGPVGDRAGQLVEWIVRSHDP